MMMKTSRAAAVALCAFALVILLNPGVLHPTLDGFEQIAWLFTAAVTIVFSGFALPAAFAIISRVRGEKAAVKSEYLKAAAGYVLLAISLILVTLYSTVLPQLVYPTVFVILVTTVLWSEYIVSFVRRKDSTFMWYAAGVLLLVFSLAFTLAGLDWLNAVYFGTRFTYLISTLVTLAVFCYYAYFASGNVLGTGSYRTMLIPPQILIIISTILITLSETTLKQYSLLLYALRALLLAAATILYYRSEGALYDMVMPFPELKPQPKPTDLKFASKEAIGEQLKNKKRGA